jgi:hypothetical protein
VVVLSAIYSMWGYFRAFFSTVVRGERKRATPVVPEPSRETLQ